MKYAYEIYRFFLNHWDEVREAAQLAVTLWLIVGGLAPKLADRLRGLRDAGLAALGVKRG